MKRLMIFIALTLVLGGCDNAPYGEKTIYKATESFVKREEYNGHYYIKFDAGYSYSYVHDPDCPCHKKNK